MDIVRYQKFVNKSSIFPRSTQGRNLSYLVMGMVEEVGEIYEFVLKQDSLDENHPQHNILSKYCDLIYIVLERNLYNTINNHPTWDGGIINHAKKLCEIKGFIDNEINILLDGMLKSN